MAFPSLLQRWHHVPMLQGTSFMVQGISLFPCPGQASARIPVGSAHTLLTWRIQGWNGAKTKAATLSKPVKGVQWCRYILSPASVSLLLQVTLTQIPKNPGLCPPALQRFDAS